MALIYAQITDLEAYVEGWVTDDIPATTRLLERAQKDIDSIIGPWGVAELDRLQTLPSSTLYVSSTTTLRPTGTVSLNGTLITYTGKTPTTLTGTSGGSGDVPLGSTLVAVTPSGLKFDPISQLSAAQQTALKRATCAQAEYRFTMTEAFFVKAQYAAVSGPDFSQSGELPYIGPKVLRELQGFGLLLETYVG